jgi:hypothetical protein
MFLGAILPIDLELVLALIAICGAFGGWIVAVNRKENSLLFRFNQLDAKIALLESQIKMLKQESKSTIRFYAYRVEQLENYLEKTTSYNKRASGGDTAARFLLPEDEEQ